MNVIASDRLDLVLLERDSLDDLIAGRVAAVERRISATIPQRWVEDSLPLVRMRREQITRDPTSAPWLLRAIVLRSERRVVGHVNFHGPPASEGWVEIGYSILTEYRRKGLAVEAARAMFDWANRNHGVATFRASVGPWNVPSLRMIQRFGLTKIGVQWDEEDGEEIVFEGPWPPTGSQRGSYPPYRSR